MKFVWKGWYDCYETCHVPTLIDHNDKILWQGHHYYGSELQEKYNQLIREVMEASIKHNIHIDLAGPAMYWDFEDQRQFSL